MRYLNFLGCPTKLFNAGNMRRKEGNAGVDAAFFDLLDEEAELAELELAVLVVVDLHDDLLQLLPFRLVP